MSGGKRLLLLGGGHSQLAVLQALARERPTGWQVILVTPQPRMLYSGMLPGWMAGHYRLGECAIDLQRLAAAAGVELRLGAAVALDAGQRCVSLADGSVVGYERLSLDIGSGIALGPLSALTRAKGDSGQAASGQRPSVDDAASRRSGGVAFPPPSETSAPSRSSSPIPPRSPIRTNPTTAPAPPLLLPVRPLAGFVSGWRRIVTQAAARPDFALAVVGAGAGGAELAFAARHRLGCAVSLVCGDAGLLPGHAAAVQRRARHWLEQRGVALLSGPALPQGPALRLADGSLLQADAVIAATGSQPAGWLAQSGLALTESGQVQVDACQRSVSHAAVFAAGDVSQRSDGALASSGVHAVRAGPVLADNLLASLRDAPLRGWRPRDRSLYLLSTGERHALMSYGRFSLAGGWVWRWKDHIDRAFIARHGPDSARAA